MFDIKRCVAQLGRALRSGRRGRRFKSCRIDEKSLKTNVFKLFCYKPSIFIPSYLYFLHLRCLVVAALVCVILLLFFLTLVEKFLELSGQFAELVI